MINKLLTNAQRFFMGLAGWLVEQAGAVFDFLFLSSVDFLLMVLFSVLMVLILTVAWWRRR